MSCVDGIVTIGVSGTRLKDHLEFGYLGMLGLAFGDALGKEVMVHVVLQSPTRIPNSQTLR